MAWKRSSVRSRPGPPNLPTPYSDVNLRKRKTSSSLVKAPPGGDPCILPPCLGLRGFGAMFFRCNPRQDEFLKEIRDGGNANANARVLKSQFGAIAVLGRIVEIRNAARRQAAQDIRVIRLPASIVSLANDGVGHR